MTMQTINSKHIKYYAMGAINITDMYMEALSSLSNEEKVDLISKLSKSILAKKKGKKAKGLEMFDCLHKDWGGDRSPEDIAEELRKARVFERETTSW